MKMPRRFSFQRHDATYNAPQLCDHGKIRMLTKGGRGPEAEDGETIVWGNEPVIGIPPREKTV